MALRKINVIHCSTWAVWSSQNILEDLWSMLSTGARRKVSDLLLLFTFCCFAVSKPAPDWNGTAVVGDPPSFKDVRLSDFKGTWLFHTYMYVM